MSAIQNAGKSLTLKHDSKQIDISILNVESTYLVGTNMTMKHFENLDYFGCVTANEVPFGFISFLADQPLNLVQGEAN